MSPMNRHNRSVSAGVVNFRQAQNTAAREAAQRLARVLAHQHANDKSSVDDDTALPPPIELSNPRQATRSPSLAPPKQHSAWHSLRKGINPRTRASQLKDLVSFKGISQYDGDLGDHTSLPSPAELLMEEHHSNYGEPWAGGRDVFEFFAFAMAPKSSDLILEVGCGTLRVGLHFIRYLDSSHFHCFERDELSLLAALRYELPSQGLLNKRPLIRKRDDMDFSGFGKDNSFDRIYASAVFFTF